MKGLMGVGDDEWVVRVIYNRVKITDLFILYLTIQACKYSIYAGKLTVHLCFKSLYMTVTTVCTQHVQ